MHILQTIQVELITQVQESLQHTVSKHREDKARSFKNRVVRFMVPTPLNFQKLNTQIKQSSTWSIPQSNLAKAREEQVEGGPSWAPLLRLQTGVEGARVE